MIDLAIFVFISSTSCSILELFVLLLWDLVKELYENEVICMIIQGLSERFVGHCEGV